MDVMLPLKSVYTMPDPSMLTYYMACMYGYICNTHFFTQSSYSDGREDNML